MLTYICCGRLLGSLHIKDSGSTGGELHMGYAQSPFLVVSHLRLCPELV